MYVATLTVTDNAGTKTGISHRVSVTAPPHPTFVAAHSRVGRGPAVTVRAPRATRPGDVLLLFVTTASGAATATPPAGWHQVVSVSRHRLTSTVYRRTAHSSDAGRRTAITLPGRTHAAATIAAFSGAATQIQRVRHAADAGGMEHTSPVLRHLGQGSLVVSFWSDRRNGSTRWSTSTDVAVRSSAGGKGHQAVSALLTDSRSAVAGRYGGVLALSHPGSDAGITLSIALSAR
jgi:hypothetical protein